MDKDMEINADSTLITTAEDTKKPDEEWKKYRWLVLILAIVGGIGPYFGFNLSVTEYTVVVSMCGLPNIVCAAGTGLLLDKIGRGPAVLGTLACLLFGNALAWLACMQTSYLLLLAGCLFFSVGSQGYLVVANSLEAFWFKDKETSVALGLDTSFSYLCVAAIYCTMPALYNATGSLAWPFAISIFLSALSGAAGIAVTLMDRIAVKNTPKKTEKKSEGPALSLGALKMLGYGYLLLALSYACRVLSYNLFEFVSSEYFHLRFGFNIQEAGMIISIPYVCFALLTAPCGILIYRIGRKPLITAVALIVMTLSMCWLGFIDNGKGVILSIAPFAVFSIANVFVAAALWPSIPYVVPTEMLGIAYGLMISILNVCIGFGPIILGLIHDATEKYDYGYAWSLAFIIIWLILGVFDSILIAKYDGEHGYKLYIPEAVNKA